MSAASPRTVAFVGLGRMGTPMASRLAPRFDLRVHDARAEAAAAFVGTYGGRAARSLAEALDGADAAITMLPKDAQVREVMLGPGGVRDVLPRGGLAIDMGTSSPGSTREIGAALAVSGLTMVDAPVMGGVPFARDGTLDIMVGGDADAIERVRPLLEAMGRKVWRCGGPGTGHALKAIANFANAATLATFLEALAMGRKAGLDTAFLVDALSAMCTRRQHPLDKKIVPQVVTRRFASGMAMGLIAKDLGIAVELAGDIGARADVASTVLALWEEAARTYGADVDQTELARLWEDAAGVVLE